VPVSETENATITHHIQKQTRLLKSKAAIHADLSRYLTQNTVI
jgi:hypothetical protein